MSDYITHKIIRKVVPTAKIVSLRRSHTLRLPVSIDVSILSSEPTCDHVMELVSIANRWLLAPPTNWCQ